MKDVIKGILADDKGVRFAVIFCQNVIASRLLNPGKVADIVGFTGSRVLYTAVGEAVIYGAAIRAAHLEGDRRFAADCHILFHLGQITDLVNKNIFVHKKSLLLYINTVQNNPD